MRAKSSVGKLRRTGGAFFNHSVSNPIKMKPFKTPIDTDSLGPIDITPIELPKPILQPIEVQKPAPQQTVLAKHNSRLKLKSAWGASPRRDFNSGTLANAHAYLVQNKGNIKFEKNESGFIRTTFPDDVLIPDEKTPPLSNGERLRANFWYYKDSDCGLGDESIHDHPNSFQSYIVNGGYEHEIYELVERTKLQLDPNMLLEYEQLWVIYQAYIKHQQDQKKFHFAIDKGSKHVLFKGEVNLKLQGVETTKKGDIVNIDNGLIHRVSKYHTVPDEKTLSMNIVRNSGKGLTNIFLPERKEAAVKTSREEVSVEDTAAATEEMISLFANSLRP